jgi:hypothetical protein
MFQDAKVSHSEEGDTRKEESKSTVTVEVKINEKSMVF